MTEPPRLRPIESPPCTPVAEPPWIPPSELPLCSPVTEPPRSRPVESPPCTPVPEPPLIPPSEPPPRSPVTEPPFIPPSELPPYSPVTEPPRSRSIESPPCTPVSEPLLIPPSEPPPCSPVTEPPPLPPVESLPCTPVAEPPLDPLSKPPPCSPVAEPPRLPPAESAPCIPVIEPPYLPFVEPPPIPFIPTDVYPPSLSSPHLPLPPVPLPPIYCDISKHLSNLTLDITTDVTSADDAFLLPRLTPTESSGALYWRSFGSFVPPKTTATTSIKISIDGFEYERFTQSVALYNAQSIRMVLLSETVYVDRSSIRVMLQLYDEQKNPHVSINGLSVELLASLRESRVTTFCDTQSFINSNDFYIQHCDIPHLPSTWFLKEDEIILHAHVRYADNTFLSQSTVVRVVPEPLWYSSLSFVLSTAGSFASLPVSPKFQYEIFDVQTFAHTGGFALETWWIFVDFNTSLLEFVAFEQNKHFNGVSFTTEDVGDRLTRLGFNAVGTKGTTMVSDVTGNAVPLVVITFRVKHDAPFGSHANVLSIFTRQFINPGSNPFVSDLPGVVLDGFSRAIGNQTAAMWVREVTDVALFAYMPQGTMLNFAPLTGQSVINPMTIIKANDDDRLGMSSKSLVQRPACVPVISKFVHILDNCTILFTEEHNESAQFLSVVVQYKNLHVELSFAVYNPLRINLHLLDNTLERIVHADMNHCHYSVFQQTRGILMVDGFDVSALVEFDVVNTSVANVVHGQVVRGVQPGSTQVYVVGRSVSFASALLTVDDRYVSSRRLIGRIVNSVEWEQAPPSQVSTETANFVVVARAQQILRAEGHSARLHVAVEWSDGIIQDIASYDDTANIFSTLNVTSLSDGIDLTPPLPSDPFWTLSVALGAAPECGDLVHVEWLMCGMVLANGNAPVFLDIPKAKDMILTASHSRLSDPSDDCTASPINIKSWAFLHVAITFADGSIGSFDSDSRVHLAVTNVKCASIVQNSDGSRKVIIAIGALLICQSVTVVAYVESFGLSSNLSIPLVQLASLELDFLGYPNMNGNDAIHVRNLGRIHCSSSSFHHATARVRAFLSDDLTQPYIVTAASMLTSNNTNVVIPEGERMWALAPGVALLNATFAFRSFSEAVLTIDDKVLNPVVDVRFSASLSATTFRGKYHDTFDSIVMMTFSNGLIFSNVAALSPWIRRSDLFTFNSSMPSVLSVSSSGLIRLLDNWHTKIAIRCALACDMEINDEILAWVNLDPEELDIDMGYENEGQFQQIGGELPIEVRIRTPLSERLVNFQLVAGPFDPTCLSSAHSLYREGSFGGVQETLNDPPENFQLAASDQTSQLTGLVNVGTVRLTVLGSCVTLIQAEIIELFTVDLNGIQHSYGGRTMLAGRGFASLMLPNGRRGLKDIKNTHITRAHPTRKMQECVDSCIEDGGVWGDVNGDCQFTSADVLSLQAMVNSRNAYLSGRSDFDPISSWCNWRQKQANPSLDFAYDNVPRIDLEDAQYLLFTVAKKYRFLAEASAKCVFSSRIHEAKEYSVRARVLHGERTSNPGATAAQTTVRVHFRLINVGAAQVTMGNDTTPLSWTRQELLVHAKSLGNGFFEARDRKYTSCYIN
eukprot:6212379-Pleurochrysis_carterae.AAC.1